MRRSRSVRVAQGACGLALVLAVAACGADSEPAARNRSAEGIVTAASVTEPAVRLDATLPPAQIGVLVFTHTRGFRHDVLGAPGAFDGPAPAALRQLAAEQGGVSLAFTEDPAAFTDTDLAGYRAVVFLHTTGDVLDPAGEAALQRYVESGGGFAGVHSATDTEYVWPWYGELIGTYFRSHPAVMEATIRVEDTTHPATAHLPAEWVRSDEWYGFQTNPRGSVRVLATLDESTYVPGDSAMGSDHPISWCHDVGVGQAWYTALGHTAASYSEAAFLQHVWGGILSVAGARPADCAF